MQKYLKTTYVAFLRCPYRPNIIFRLLLFPSQHRAGIVHCLSYRHEHSDAAAKTLKSTDTELDALRSLNQWRSLRSSVTCSEPLIWLSIYSSRTACRDRMQLTVYPDVMVTVIGNYQYYVVIISSERPGALAMQLWLWQSVGSAR